MPPAPVSDVVIILGPGGAGKTTLSIAWALRAAGEGRRVGLLSIDPARRLADALGLTLGSELEEVPGTEGRLHAAMLDPKAVFDQMVVKHAPDPAAAEGILANRLYQTASSKIAGVLEYMALARLQELATCGEYDVVVLDTPPDSHALDFLGRPNVLARFQANRVMNWLIKPFNVAHKLGVGRMLSASERLMGGLARVTGLPALALFSEFLVLIQQVIDGFQRSGEEAQRILQSPKAAFWLITAPTERAGATAERLALELRALGYPLDGMIVNGCLPPTVAASARELGEVDLPGWTIVRAQAEEERRVMAQLKVLGKVTAVAHQEGPLHSLTAMLGLAEELDKALSAR